eukprot:gb/GFBE01043287.1/.p1 GENE.gb/GFBE01043287.1/~~gb/GFBE01043287.1/.p1  ORF type:complete len:577 (+),score=93.70 gb/GFBE01043287.1/:1-1731(+)
MLVPCAAMSWLCRCLLLALLPCVVKGFEAGLGVRRYNASNHQPRKSAGCGKKSPYAAGKTTAVTATYAGTRWHYRIYVPAAYDRNTPLPVILQFPGWGMSAKVEENGAGISALADRLGYISVTPQGKDDNDNWGGPWYSWNAVGSTQSPGPAGPTCTWAANHADYCYSSCKCKDQPQCDWTTCDEGITPTGTGLTNIGGYIPGLYNTLEHQLCIDTTREFAAGESNGGMMAYQTGVDLAHRLAAIVPQFGSFHRGFNLAPPVGLPVLDLHGTEDTTVPANVSLADNGYYYTVTSEIFGGNAFSPGWKASNGCKGPDAHYPTEWDGQDQLYCVSVGNCPGGDVVRCSWHGGHNWFGNSAKMNGGLVTEFLLKWTRPSHVGGGYSYGEEVQSPHFLENISILEEEDPSWLTEAAASDANAAPEGKHVLQAGTHYGDPDAGCMHDEEIIRVGSGRACAPRIKAVLSSAADEMPSPMCRIGGSAPFENGCPMDAAASANSLAWPVCLGKANATNAYEQGEFHCLLVCPCPGVGKDCGAAADAHCPGASRCERGVLLNRAHGLCTYHGAASLQSDTSAVVI